MRFKPLLTCTTQRVSHVPQLFAVVAFPCNSFGGQEPDPVDQILGTLQGVHGIEPAFPLVPAKVRLLSRNSMQTQQHHPAAFAQGRGTTT